VKRVLLAAYGGAHVAVAIPLHHALLEAGLEPVVLGLTTAAEVFERHGIACKRFIDYVDLQDAEIRRWADYLCPLHHREGIGIRKEESAAYLGASMAELVRDVGEAEALARYRRSGLNAFVPAAVLRDILRREAIDGVIATDSPRAERAALNAAAELGLPSVCVVSNFPDIGLHYLRRADNGAVMCVLNERIRAQLVDAGRSPDSVVATGNPAFDALTSPDDPVLRTRLREQAGIGQDDWTVLWAEQPEPADPQLPLRMREHLARVCRVNGWRLLVRLHPSSQASAREAMPPYALTSPRSEHVRDALLKSDAVVTFTSTIGFEALVLDKPVVVAALSQYSAFVDYRETDGVLVVDSLDAVEPALVSLFRGDETAQILAAHRRAMPRNGRAAQAIVQCLLSQQAPAPMEQFPA
jgi:hypothetical protein